MTRSRLFLLLLLTVASAPAAGCFPLRQGSFSPPTAAEVGPVLDNYGEAVVPAHGLIVAQGDDLIYGVDPRSRRLGINGSDVHRTRTTIPETLRRTLHPVTIVNLGYPGDTAAQGAQRWADAPVGNLLILSYGYGDAFARTPLPDYHRALAALVRRAHARGAAVFLVTAPPLRPRSAAAVVAVPAATVSSGGRKHRSTSSPTTPEQASTSISAPNAEPASELNSLLETYRVEMRKVGAEEGAEVFEPQTQLTQFKIDPSNSVVQTSAIYQAIAGELAPYIKIVQDSVVKRQTRKLGMQGPAQP